MKLERSAILGGILVVALAVAGGLAHFASSDPDGLEHVAAQLGFAGRERPSPVGLFPDYTVPGLGVTGAGLLGTLLVAGLLVGLGRLLARKDA